MKFLRKYSAFLDGLTKVLAVLLGTLLSAMCLIMFYQVIMRYCFHNSKPWCEELTLYFFIYLTFIGLGVATRRCSHLQVDFITSKYSPRMRCLMEAINGILFIVVFIIIFYFALSLISHASAKSVTLPLNMKQIYMVFPISSIISVIYGGEVVIKNLVGFKNNGVIDMEGGSEA